MPSQKPILHLATGGTIDSHWDPAQDTATVRGQSIIPSYLDAVRYRGVILDTICMKDSREITMQDRRELSDRVAETSYDRVLVTSGTYLMPDFSRLIQNHPMAQFFDPLDRRVVLTGSIKPMEGFLRSDGGFNLGMSMAALQEETLARVNVVMNGSCFKGGDVQKDMSTASFQPDAGVDQLPYQDFDLVTAGGSIDFDLNGLDQLVPSRESSVPGFLRRSARTNHPFQTINPFIKDSRNISEEDLKLVLEMIHSAKTDHVLVTTGIIKIREIQQYLKDHLSPEFNKQVVLTGSRFPLGITDRTDAPFNLGYALGRLGFLSPGVHIALNGKVFEDDEDVMKSIYTPEEIEILERQSSNF